MTDRPILFSGEMVRAILEGRKTQTRRVVKPQPELMKLNDDSGVPLGEHWTMYTYSPDEAKRAAWPVGDTPHWTYCPYGKVGDRLWVRETWHCPRQLGGSHQREKLIFRADEPNPWLDYKCVRWAPSIFMPRWASRLTLEITDVRVERIRDISPGDCRAEGADGGDTTTDLGWRYSFGSLWNSINEKRGYGWLVNPWVWVIQFKCVTNCRETVRHESHIR